MKSLKLNALNRQLNKKEMNEILAGGNEASTPTCGCACAYAGNGGSSFDANGAANQASGLVSPGGGAPYGPPVVVVP